MSRQAANLIGEVVLTGREDSIKKVYKDLNLPGRNKINKRSGERYTEFGEGVMGEGRNEKGTRVPKMTFSFQRNNIYGNWESDIDRHIMRSIVRLNVDVKMKLNNVVRTPIAANEDTADAE